MARPALQLLNSLIFGGDFYIRSSVSPVQKPELKSTATFARTRQTVSQVLPKTAIGSEQREGRHCEDFLLTSDQGGGGRGSRGCKVMI